MKLYKLKKNDTLKLKRVIEDYNKVHENRVSVNAKNHNKNEDSTDKCTNATASACWMQYPLY